MTATVRAAERRRTETPNGVMTTLASPTQGPTAGLSLWQVEMRAGVTGPHHTIDSEQLWTVLDGEVTIAIGAEPVDLAAGDTIVIPAGVERQVTSRSAVRLMLCGRGDAVATVVGEEQPRGTPAWIA